MPKILTVVHKFTIINATTPKCTLRKPLKVGTIQE